MGFRFYRRIRLLPGVRLNLGSRSASVSVGQRGSWLTFGRRRRSASVGLPGTGLRYTSGARWVLWLVAAVIVVRLLWVLVRQSH